MHAAQRAVLKHIWRPTSVTDVLANDYLPGLGVCTTLAKLYAVYVGCHGCWFYQLVDKWRSSAAG
jgi:hypothetical protein